MIYMTWGQIANPQFKLALSKLMTTPLQVRISNQINSIVQLLNIELHHYDERVQSLRDTYAVVLNGDLVVPTKFEQAYLDGMRQIEAEQAEIQVPRLPMSEIENLELSAQDLHYLEPILEK